MSLHPSTEVLASLRAQHGDAIEIAESDDFTVVVRPAKKGEYDPYLAGQAGKQTKGDAAWNLLITCAVWPGLAELRALRERWAAVADLVTDELDEMAGSKPKVTPFEQLSLEQLEQLATAGVPLDELRQRFHHKGQLVAVFTARGPLVEKAPTLVAYESFKRNRSENFAAAIHALTLDSAVWPSPEIVTGHLEALPALPSGLQATLLGMAGGLIKARRKKI